MPQPTPPNISTADVWRQFKIDITGREVQTAPNYSYLWIALQVGHICNGILLQFGGMALLAWLWPGVPLGIIWAGAVIAALVIIVWEINAYRITVNQAAGRFPLNRTGLLDNTLVAAGYMIIGALLGAGFQSGIVSGLIIFAALLLVAALIAPYWIRQKMVWQKAGLPFLFRLANARKTIAPADAESVQAVLEAGAPPASTPTTIIIDGKFKTGRTSLASGIGTEYAFRNVSARYLPMAKLMELLATDERYTGPTNIDYWPFTEAQVLIIDDVSPQLPATAADALQLFKDRMDALQSHWTLFQDRHTVWVLGEASSTDLSAWQDAIVAITAGTEVLKIHLDEANSAL